MTGTIDLLLQGKLEEATQNVIDRLNENQENYYGKFMDVVAEQIFAFNDQETLIPESALNL